MYDKVNLFYPRMTDTPDISGYLNNAEEHINLKTGEVKIFGNLKGMKVSLHGNGAIIIGSLSKYLYGSNVYPLDIHSTEDVVTKLSDDFHIDMRDARVFALEFGAWFPMRKPVDEYLKKLGDMPKLQRCTFTPSSLYYKHKGKRQPKVFHYYDKKAELEKNGGKIPDGFANANMLKYEMRLNKPLAQQLGVQVVYASTLYDPEFYRMLVKKWQNHYFSIEKLNPIKTNIMSEIINKSEIKTVTDAVEVVMALSVDKSKVEARFEELKAMKVFDERRDYTRLKNRLVKIVNRANVSVSDADEDIRELDDCIKNKGAEAYVYTSNCKFPI